jgi:hypothetical protein
MIMNLNLAQMLTGYVRIANDAGDVVEGKNLVVYGGGDIIARTIAGYTDYAIAYMYFAYQNGGTPPSVAPARTDTVSFFSSLTNPRDYLRVPIRRPVAASTRSRTAVARSPVPL